MKTLRAFAAFTILTCAQTFGGGEQPRVEATTDVLNPQRFELAWIDSHPEVPGGQGQDFTFNILSAAGISYLVDDHWKISVGALYQHLSNGGQTDPNPSLNLFGPQVGVSYSF